jgi:HMG (high mobility group) box
MVKKPIRDPSAPKRNMSAYLLYQNAMRDQFKAMNPGMTFGQLAKYTSAMYAELPPSEKEAWVQRAEEDKARYLHELSTYVPPPGFDPKGDAIVVPLNQVKGHQVAQAAAAAAAAAVAAASGRPKGKIEKDSNAPKRNMSAYLLYQNAMREQFKRENPGMTFGQLAKYTSHMYRNLTPGEKALWEQRSQQDKARYDAEIAGYVPPPGHDARGVLIEDHRPRKRAKRGPKDPAAPKRASGAYVFFTNEMRPKVLQEYPGIKFVELGRVLGERWRALTPVQKKRFEDIATEDKMRFQMEMQRYSSGGIPPPPHHIHHAVAPPPVAQPTYHQPPPQPRHHVPPPQPPPQPQQHYQYQDQSLVGYDVYNNHQTDIYGQQQHHQQAMHYGQPPAYAPVAAPDSASKRPRARRKK